MKNVLINAYAVSPNWGSEPGVGWNWVINIAKHCNVFVITEGEWQKEIEEAVAKLPQKDNIHFYYNPVPEKVRKMCWNQGDWRFYWYYRKWQKKTLEIARKIISENKIDVIHQLNMIGFREPGYLWKIKGIPFVWGPVGNMSPLNLTFLKGASKKEIAKQWIKNKVSELQVKTGRVKNAIKNSDQIITVLENSAKLINKLYGKNNVVVMPETGLTVSPKVLHQYGDNRPLKLLWVGRFITTKKLDVALQVLSKVRYIKKYELTIVGWGSEEEELYYKQLSTSLGISEQCVWKGKINHSEVQQLMKESDVFLFTSVVEGTPHVILEAISNNLPVLCFDTCGQGVIVNDSVGWKIKMTSLEDSTEMLVNRLNEIESNRHIIASKSENCEIRKPELSWESKINQVIKIYESLQ